MRVRARARLCVRVCTLDAVRAAILSRAAYSDPEALRGLVPVDPSVSGGRCAVCVCVRARAYACTCVWRW